MANINDFIAQVKTNGMARTNRYAVNVNLPFQFDNYTLRAALLFCDQIQLPGINYNTSDTRTYGEVRKAPYEKLYEDINMSFYVDKDMQVKNLFDQWQAQIMDPVTRQFNYYDNYVTDIDIYVQDTFDNTTYMVSLYEAYPKSIGAVQLDYAAKDIMKLSVNFAYKWYQTYPQITQSNTATYQVHNNTFPVNPYANVTSNGDPIQSSFTSRLSNFAIGAAGAALVSKLPNLIKF
jgi:hypothetical protein